MIGITSYGAYVPFARLNRKLIGEAWGTRAAPGEKAVACFDEDSITMAVDAGRDCIRGFNPDEVGGVFLATTTPPYKEKLSASVVADAMDSPRELRVADFTDSLRAGTIAFNSAVDAVKAGTIKNALVIASDCRLGAPAGEFEQLLGDGAAALLVGDSGVIASIESSYSVSDELVDVWRTYEDTFVRSWEDRWVVSEGYTRVVKEAVSGVLKLSGLAPKDFTKAVVYAHDARSHPALLRSLGFDLNTQVQDPLITTVGHTGTAQVLMTLVSALETAKPGDRILVASYENGSDAFILQVTEEIQKLQPRQGVTGHLEPKRMLPNYEKYLRWRQLLPLEAGARRPSLIDPSASARYREGTRVSSLHAQKCKQCGAVQYHELHRMRVCYNCQAKDQFEEVSLSNKKGKVFTFTLDNLGVTVDPPIIYTVVDFEGGGRIMCQGTNVEPSELKLGLPVEMCFRKLYSSGGIHNYFWKSRPIR